MIDSGLRHALVAGEYEHRRIECEEALRRCQRLMPDVTRSRRHSRCGRCRESVASCRRPCPSGQARGDGDGARARGGRAPLVAARSTQFGELLYAGHESLRRDFESSCDEADAIVALARKAGATGARLTGGRVGRSGDRPGAGAIGRSRRDADPGGICEAIRPDPAAVVGEGEQRGEDRVRGCRLEVPWDRRLSPVPGSSQVQEVPRCIESGRGNEAGGAIDVVVGRGEVEGKGPRISKFRGALDGALTDYESSVAFHY